MSIGVIYIKYKTKWKKKKNQIKLNNLFPENALSSEFLLVFFPHTVLFWAFVMELELSSLSAMEA